MKRALITIATMSILTSTAWVVAANAQANINPNLYPGNTSERYGAQPYEWPGSPGPMRRGNMCVKDPLARLRLPSAVPGPPSCGRSSDPYHRPPPPASAAVG